MVRRFAVTFLGLAIFGAAGALAAQTGASEPKIKQLTVEEIKSHLKKGNIFWLDVREPKELEEIGTVKGHVNIPLSQLESRLAEIPKDKLVVPL